jgi:4-carboxymuconolactone decarboxylase
MPRLPDIDPASLTTEQRRVYRAILAGPRGVVQGPLRVWVNSPGLADTAQALGAFCRYGTSLPARLSELAIVTTGAHWKAGFEWAVHAPIAVASGIDPEALEAIRTGRAPHFERPDERAVYRFASELLRNRHVSDETYRAAIESLGQLGVVDLVGVLGYYGLISMTIKAFEVPLPEGAPEPFPV